MLRHHAVLFFVLALAGASLDLLTKHWAFAYNPDGRDVVVIDGLFNLGKTLNTGIVFGKFSGAKTLWLVISVAAVPAITAIFFMVRNRKWIVTISLGMVLAGTIGNMYDRIFWDGVRDFIKFYVRLSDGGEKVWPLFNLADSFICVGVFLLSIEMIFFDEKKKKKDESPKTEPEAASEPVAKG